MNRVKRAWEILFDDPLKAPQPLIVEVEGAQRLEPPTPEVRESIIGLQYNPGYQYLSKKRRFQRAVLEARLKTQKHSDLREVDLLQGGIGWLNWIEAQEGFEVGRKERETKPASSYEQELFEKINSNFTVLQ
jgi:hypothetical protein